MFIRTKFNIGQKICALDEAKCVEFIVSSISIDCTNEYCSVFYYSNTDGDYKCYDEKLCFSSKEELVKQL